MMINDKLTQKDIFEVKKSAEKMRSDYNNEPLGEKIYRIVRNNDIHLIYYPIETSGENSNPFRAVYLSAKGINGEKMRFIAINTNDYLDSILFAIGHELYHFIEDAPIDIYRSKDEETKERREQKANRFAAELLLPEEAIKHEIGEWNNGNYTLNKWEMKKLLRFIAYLQCQYWVPFKCVVLRLYETKAISSRTVAELLKEDARNPQSQYYKVAVAANQNVFNRLNCKLNTVGIESVDMEILLENYENGIISVDEIAKDLSYFNKTLHDYDLEEPVSSDALDDLNSLFEELEDDSE